MGTGKMCQALVRDGSRQARRRSFSRRTWMISVGFFLWRRGVWFAYDLILNHSCLLKPAAPFILEFPTNTQAVPDRQDDREGGWPADTTHLGTPPWGLVAQVSETDSHSYTRGVDRTKHGA